MAELDRDAINEALTIVRLRGSIVAEDLAEQLGRSVAEVVAGLLGVIHESRVSFLCRNGWMLFGVDAAALVVFSELKPQLRQRAEPSDERGQL